MIGHYRKGKNGLYCLSKVDIENEVENLLCEYDSDLLKNPQEIPIDNIIELHLDIPLIFSQIDIAHSVLGMALLTPGNVILENFDGEHKEYFSKPSIIVDDYGMEINEGMFRFTLAHECGHHFLQRDLYAIHQYQLSLFDVDGDENSCTSCRDNAFIFKGKTKELKTREDFQEWQANYFASCVLMPRSAVRILFKEYIDGGLLINMTSSLKRMLILQLVDIFKVSKEAAEYRFDEIFGKERGDLFCKCKY